MLCLILAFLYISVALGLLAGSLVVACCLVKVTRPSLWRALLIVLTAGFIHYLCCHFVERAMGEQSLCCVASAGLGFLISCVVYAAFIPTTIAKAALVNLLVSILYGFSLFGLCVIFGGIAAIA